MNILNELREQIGLDEVRMLSSFLGENEDSLNKSTDLSITAILQGLVHQLDQNSGASGIMNVIRDGGHSGDIIDDLKGLFSNQDKTQLLVTIGNNINNHFFGNISSAVGDKISEFGGIKKTSAASLFSLCSPLVLGFIGKKVKSERMTARDLSNLLTDQKSTLQGYLPPAIFSLFGTKKIVEKVEENSTTHATSVATTVIEETKIPKNKTTKDSNIFGILAWLLLAGLVIAAAYYSLRNKGNEELSETVNYQESAVANDSTTQSELLNDSFGNAEDRKEEAISTEEFSTEESSNTSKSVLPSKEPETDKSASAPSNSNLSKKTSTSPVTNAERTSEPRTQSFTNYAPIKSQLDKIGSWGNLSSSVFKGSTAEIKNSQELNDLASMMKQNSAKVLKIVGLGKSRQQEDRAYAIRGKLYELGVPLSQLEIVSGPSSNDGSVIMKFD